MENGQKIDNLSRNNQNQIDQLTLNLKEGLNVKEQEIKRLTDLLKKLKNLIYFLTTYYVK